MPDDDRVAEILGDFCDRCERGEAVTPEEVIAAHPELGAELREGFAALDLVDLAFSPAVEPRELPFESVGPYRVLEELGSGGMGTVYLAEVKGAVQGLAVGRRVALKVVHPHLLSRSGFFKRFLREGDMGKRVVHENVVRTIDVDALKTEGETVHFLVMELVEGRTLRELLTDLRAVPEALLREIARQAAAGLEAIHAEGIVHRDLKPENLIITADHRVRIMDLGVAKVAEDSLALTEEGQFAGSLLYAAPEQFGTAEVGPAADLYSLGVLLYELGTGGNPFRRDQAAAVMSAHLEHDPPRASEVNLELSLFFSEIISTLLAKEPPSRFESAEALRATLEDGERSAWWKEQERAIRKGGRRLPTVPVRRDTKLHGRAADLEALRDVWERARRGEGGTLLVEGEAGIGKSRLMDAFLQEFAGDGAQVLYGSYPPAGGMGGLSDAILAQFGSANLEESLRPHLPVTPRLVPAFASLVRHETPPEGCEPIQGDALHTVFVNLMRGIAEEKPLLWVVEDLHFADPDSRQILLSLARAVEGHPILLLLTTRPDLSEGELAHFSRLENFRRTGLGRLSAREVILLLEDAFRSEKLAEKLGGRIAKKSDGVPFFVFEMIRGLKEGQFIEQLPDGTWVDTKVIEEIEVPSAVRDLIEARLRDLTKEERALLDVGAVQGFEFDPGLTAAVVRRPLFVVLQDLAAVERRSGVIRGQGPSYRFDHHQIQEVVYGDLHERLRAECHAAVGEAFASEHGLDQERPQQASGEAAAFLASHHLKGSHPRASLPFLMTALEHLADSFRNQATIDLAGEALEIPVLLEGRERAEVLLKKAGCLGLLGERDRERSALDEVMELADGLDDVALQARACLRMGRHLERISEFAAAQETLEQALDRARVAGEKRTEGIATNHLGNVCWKLGRREEANEHHRRCRDLGREIGDRYLELLGIAGLGRVYYGLGRFGEARECIEEQLSLARELGNLRSESAALGDLGHVFMSLGRRKKAREYFETHLAMARQIGDRWREAYAMRSLSHVLLRQGRLEQAREHQEYSLAVRREIGDRAGEATTTGDLGSDLAALGRYGEALRSYRQCLTLVRELGIAQEGHALMGIGGILTELGQLDLAEDSLRDALAVVRRDGARSLEGYALDLLGFVAQQRCDFEEAERLYEEAIAIRREISHAGGLANTLAVLGQVMHARGAKQTAAVHLEEALALAQETDAPSVILSTTVERARLEVGDVETALSAFEEYGERVAHGTRMEARFGLWELTGDVSHLEEAHRLLSYKQDHAPEEYRETMMANVPLHRDIMAAWAEYGEP